MLDTRDELDAFVADFCRSQRIDDYDMALEAKNRLLEDIERIQIDLNSERRDPETGERMTPERYELWRYGARRALAAKNAQHRRLKNAIKQVGRRMHKIEVSYDDVIRERQEAIDFTVDLVDAMKRLLDGEESDGDVRLIEEAEQFLTDMQN